MGFLCAVAASARAQTNWTDQGPGPDWNDPDNWSVDLPDSSTDANHQASASDCQVNIGAAECKSFTGKGGVADRFLLIQASKKLTVVGDLKRGGLQPTAGNFVARLANGASGQLTTLDVGADFIEIDLTPIHGFGQQAHWIDLDVGGDVLDSSITVGDNAMIDVVGDVSRTSWTLGTSSADEDPTIVTLESVGVTTPNDTTWVVRGEAEVSVTTDFIAASTSSVTIEDSAVMEVASDICDGSWLVQDDAEVTLARAEHGEWTVLDDASVTSTSLLAPDELTVDDGLVTFKRLGPSAGGGAFAWDLTIKDGGQVIDGTLSWFSGSDHPGTVDGLSTNSTINYSGTGNLYRTFALCLGGAIIQTRPGSQLEIIPEDTFLIQSEIVRRVSGVTSTISFDTDWVTIRMVDILTNPTPFFEVMAPDYEGHNPDNALFCDSPCVNRWAKVIIEVTPDGGNYVELHDWFPSTPISGGPIPVELQEALYVYDLDIADDARLFVAGINIYYTGSVTIGANGHIFESFNPDVDYVPIQLTPTSYGDFNASGDGDDAADIARFNDACDSEIGVTECGGSGQPNCYDPLVDWNCDGVIDCDDRRQYLDNWPVTLDSCGCP